ncbi:MAG: DMT family transporter [Pyrinomonadaceae bacterium]
MIRIISLTAFALCAFAFNSILCRIALRGGEADAFGFSLVRLAAGAITLITISYFFGKGSKISGRGNWISAFFLFAYAICFSLAYLALNAGTGALVLFGSVQLTMILVALIRGERPGGLEWVGLFLALGGLVYLVFPGLASPPFFSSGLMAAAGISWGAYTLRGKRSGDPLAATTGNFVWAVPMMIVASIPFFSQIHLSNRGIVLAVLSGAVASGVGYTAWYAALRHHTSTSAAVLQLAVPVLVAAGGILFLSEVATTRSWVAGAMILGGIGLTIFGKGKS